MAKSLKTPQHGEQMIALINRKKTSPPNMDKVLKEKTNSGHTLRDLTARAHRACHFLHRPDTPVRRTPLRQARTLAKVSGIDELWLKFETMQKTGAYKVRGATFAVSQLTKEQRDLGVVACSAGNHSQAVACACRTYNTQNTIVMPLCAPQSKVNATRGYGAEVVQVGESFQGAAAHAKTLAEDGKTMVHPFCDPNVLAGQSSVALEMLQDCDSDLDVLVVPVGGGGLISGMALVAKAIRPDIEIYGVEAQGAASMTRSLLGGNLVKLEKVETICDGIKVSEVGDLNYAICNELIDGCVTVSEDEVKRAMYLMAERCNAIVEPAGASALAAVLSRRLPIKGKKVGLVLSGANADFHVFADILNQRAEGDMGLLVEDGSCADYTAALKFPSMDAVGGSFVNVVTPSPASLLAATTSQGYVTPSPSLDSTGASPSDSPADTPSGSPTTTCRTSKAPVALSSQMPPLSSSHNGSRPPTTPHKSTHTSGTGAH